MYTIYIYIYIDLYSYTKCTQAIRAFLAAGSKGSGMRVAAGLNSTKLSPALITFVFLAYGVCHATSVFILSLLVE